MGFILGLCTGIVNNQQVLTSPRGQFSGHTLSRVGRPLRRSVRLTLIRLPNGGRPTETLTRILGCL